jgi:hypothetical protein
MPHPERWRNESNKAVDTPDGIHPDGRAPQKTAKNFNPPLLFTSRIVLTTGSGRCRSAPGKTTININKTTPYKQFIKPAKPHDRKIYLSLLTAL